jgi:ketosteroid isomerase-like protein
MTHQPLVEGYFAACSHGDATEIARHFCPDAVVYDLNHDPITTASGIGEFYVKVRNRWHGASWHVNTYTENGDTAAIEWTMRGEAGGEPFLVRGSEHYQFQDGAISQIRQYWNFNRATPGLGLRGYPYHEDQRFQVTEGPHAS